MSGFQKWSQNASSSSTSPLASTGASGTLAPDPPTHRPERPQCSRPCEVLIDPAGGPASVPASCVYKVHSGASHRSAASSTSPDLISQGLLSLSEASSLFDLYHQRLDHFLYRILGDHNHLNTIRSGSPLLTAAVCAVGALHSLTLGHLFTVCYREFQNLVAALTFTSLPNADDVRGLCIGAFWLNELSWVLVGTAVRVSADIRLHQGIYKALKGDRNGYLDTRLYYLVYICDSHFSVAYGRPPMTRECDIIGAGQLFLETEHATEDDERLVSQVLEWSVLSRVFDTFGVDVEAQFPVHFLPPLRRFSIALDNWYADWNERFTPNRNVGNYPQKGVGLHFHFAKLYLCAHAFRGAPTAQESSRSLSPELGEIANTGVLCAMSILRVIVSDVELQSFLNGLPLYFDTMIAFAVVFLLKVATKYATAVRIDTKQILALVSETVRILSDTTRSMHPEHLLVSIAEGLEKLLLKCQELGPGTPKPVMHPFPSPGELDNAPEDLSWMENLTNFDFLSNIPIFENWSFPV